ncbi:peptidoglycan DD-metalloendopeptidase family protein [Pedobacter lithocola]|uniref:Peptidoglycan DD-metalloendopeptidase family protein n=1 Tax=Pedobacter lithocola TaxID=1908239 RepID=A0ABV8P5M3_9SPHI
MKLIQLLSISIIATLLSCKTGSVNLFKAASPHEAYQRKLITAGLEKTALGSAWINASALSMQKALKINLPYKETGYFSAEKAIASAYKFNAVRGAKINISLKKKPENGVAIYLDVWQLPIEGDAKLLASADTLGNDIKFDVDETGDYLIRLQPELLRSAEYTLELTSGPSLGFPTKTGRANIGSYWGDGRDKNNRKHEGVDIFGPFRSPVVATSNGTVTRVNENNLGGKVVWFRPTGKDYTLYYAHLDEQIAKEGTQVLAGDTLGLMGNTGNARTTPPHLHFGIYTFSGAIDPLPFINPTVKSLPNGVAPLSNLNKTLKTTGKVSLLEGNITNASKLMDLQTGTIVNVNSATGNYYKVTLPDGNTGFVKSNELLQISKANKKVKITAANAVIYDNPNSLAPIKGNLQAGINVNVLGNFGDYNLIIDDESNTGWIKK